MNDKIVVQNLVTDYEYFKGAGDKPVVVLLHGWGVSKEVWNQVFNNLKQNRISCLRLDWPGFGSSQRPVSPWSVSDYANFLMAFFKKININKVILVGHSFGGRVGLVVSATQPDLVSKLVLVDSAGIKSGKIIKTFLGIVSKFVKPVFRFRFTNPLRKKIYKAVGAEDYVATPELNKTFVKVIGEDLTKYLVNIKQPTRIIWGRKDLATPVWYGEVFNKGILNSELFVIENAGHYSFVDKFDEFMSILIEFVS